ncbi:MAG: class I SAM-dependent methyltransferase [Limnospira sp. PMC 1291.21]|nr:MULTISPECIES: class I SAM-dependent methyltransferase [Limnospira]MDT9179375.1 class I SAM-dependent methyltransferase [Limnospira sp. PMC 1238.20]MDT9194611.1 class I SAM-dependent methyltransferase [Limnospira sp. PMC 1245.20]MDT9204696.1 class I SAM-dependent methyltransferase [Limnospira sp. PMC 1243.20]MDT9209741.1 class I SAM-dependent methyltransferase [Limnospira sp. PMC 1252.20]MDT9215177.1 class I SAM-dependent methyltransferase [Limnospira sp. PMC 1256.20]
MQAKFLKSLMYEAQYKDYSPDFVMYDTLLEKNIPVVEFGSGTGRITLHLLEQGYRVFGIETDEDYQGFFLNKIQEKGSNDNFCYVTDITEVKERCNIIYPFNVLFHLNYQQVEAELNKLHKFRHYWNKLIIETDNIQYINSESFRSKFHQDQDYLFKEVPRPSQSKIIIYNEVIEKRSFNIILKFDYSLYLHKADDLHLIYNQIFPRAKFYGDFNLQFYRKNSPKLIAMCINNH